MKNEHLARFNEIADEVLKRLPEDVLLSHDGSMYAHDTAAGKVELLTGIDLAETNDQVRTLMREFRELLGEYEPRRVAKCEKCGSALASLAKLERCTDNACPHIEAWDGGNDDA